LFGSSNEVNRYVFGGKGVITGAWTWDANLQYSQTLYHVNLFGSRNNALWALGLDAVINPATGLPICRSTLTNPTNGCVPINIFGAGSIDQAAINYVTGTAYADSYYTGTNFAVNIQGELPGLPFGAGAISVAGGFESRTEHERVKADPVSDLKQWRYNGLASFGGSYNVNEGYLEAVVPVLKSQPFADNLEVNLAGRHSEYSNFGGVDTWKIGVNYTPFNSNLVRFRGTWSTDIRAPTLNELFSTATSSGQALLFDYAGNPSPDKTRHQVIAITDSGGNPNLGPETAHTIIGGVVFSPDFFGLDGLTLSVDYFKINLHNGIATLSAQNTLDQCGLGFATACSGLTRAADGTLSRVLSSNFNAQLLTREGVDLEGSYVKDLEEWFPGTPGRLTLHDVTAYVSQDSQTGVGSAGATTINSTGALGGGVPMWNGTLSAQYDVNKWQFYTQMVWVGGVLVDKTNTVAKYGGDPFYRKDNHVGLYTVFDATVTYKYTDNVSLFAGMDNIFNQSYPYNVGENLTTTSGVGGNGYYDLIGRRWKAGFRFKY